MKTVLLNSVVSIDRDQRQWSGRSYVGLEDIEGGTGQLLSSNGPAVVKSTTFGFDERHVLYGRLRPYLNKVLLPDFAGHCSTEIMPLLPTEALDRAYLWYWLTYSETVKALDATCTGARMPRANMDLVLQLSLPLPPLEEQRRIVTVLDEAFAAIATATANAEKNLANARELFATALERAFDGLAIAHSTKAVGEIAAIKGGKRVPKGYKLLSHPTPYPYLTVGDFTDDGTIDPSGIRYVSREIHNQIKRYVVRSEDLYVSIAGTIGRTGIVPAEFDGAQLTENACRLVFKPGFSNKFVYFFTKTPTFRAQAIEQTRTAAQPKLALSRLENIRLPVPDQKEQERLVQLFSQIQKHTAELAELSRRKLDALSALKQSFLHRSFTGELTTTAPDLIPA